MDFTGGKLIVHIQQAKQLKDDDFLDKIDPLCKVQWIDPDSKTEKTFQTQAIKDGGQNPLWGHEATDKNSFNIEVKDFDMPLKFQVYDGLNMLGDRLLGETTIDIDTLCFNNGIDAPFELFLKNKRAGNLYLKTKYVDNN